MADFQEGPSCQQVCAQLILSLTLNFLCLSDASNRRPLLAAECESLPDAEKWRRHIIRDITERLLLLRTARLVSL